jgi:repressor LexA
MHIPYATIASHKEVPVMKAQVMPYQFKRPIVNWDWGRSDIDPKSVEVPVLGTVAAGAPIEAIPDHQTISIPRSMVGRFETYALRVEGHSMIDENIRNGDYIIIESKETAENGETVVAMINNEEVTLKKLYIEPDHVRLEPANPSLKPIILHNHEVKILGVVCAVVRKYRYH